ncbi:hypothetical protein SAMN05216489_03554 [Streptomyces sp. 3213]|uniref:hypothetical protein n=1 Tax=Streptomyces sp. 3213.3 TaxID=1855348 RepID=UPI0008948EDF|nr:hypothetical protein [Streptomyces sp. 3213.3]SED47659.1 hypothetical protein SAMN05216489_03554 [Streptomyces sp. 3213] [Streptomyces sp. 3213.3]
MDGESGIPSPVSAGGVRIPPVLLKTLVTVVVATIAYVITNLINQSQDELWQLAVSIVIGGAALIVQYMIDFERRLSSVESALVTHHRDMKNLVSEKFIQVGEVTGIFGKLDRAGLDTENVKVLLQSATEVQSQGPDIVKAFARAELARLASTMVNLTGWTTEWPGENNDWLLGLTGCAERNIDAISSSVDLAFWVTEPARRYLDAQSEAIGRGVIVRRVFIVEAAADVNSELEEICRSQERRLIRTKIVVRSELPNDLKGGPINDCVLFDGELCYELTADRTQGNPTTTLNARVPRLGERIKRFNELWDAGRDGGPGVR